MFASGLCDPWPQIKWPAPSTLGTTLKRGTYVSVLARTRSGHGSSASCQLYDHAVRVALFTIGTAGDIVPFARAARALVARGHEVTVCTWPQYAAWFEAPVTVVDAGGSPTPADVETAFDAAFRERDVQRQIWHYCQLFFGLDGDRTRAQAAYRCAKEIVERHDVALINTLDHVAQVAAIDAGVPWASYSSRPPPHRALADDLNTRIDAALGALLSEAAGRSVRVRAFREESPHVAFAACSPHLTPDSDRRVMLTGAWLDEPGEEALPAELEAHLAGGPTLLATFGTMPDLRGRAAAVITAAQRSGWRAIVQVLPPQPVPDVRADGVLVVRDRLSFAAVLPRVAAVIHHGSVGTTHEVVRAGKPSFAIPHMGDQFFWAQTLNERGLGPPPVRYDDLDVAVLAGRMALLRDRRYRVRLATMAAAVAAEDGVAVAVAGLEAIAAGKR